MASAQGRRWVAMAGWRKGAMTVRDDIWMALHDAIGWQEGLVDAYSGMLDAPERQEALDQIKRYKAILKRRYGSTGPEYS